LLAPSSGKETRKKLKAASAGYLDKGLNTFEELKGRAEPALEELQNKVLPVQEKLQAQAKKATGPVKHEINEKITDLTNAFNKEKKVLRKKYFSGTK
jgi:gas vesicle protein